MNEYEQTIEDFVNENAKLHKQLAASERAREEAEARLRVLTWHINKHKKEWTSYEPFLDEMLAIISGDIPPCPECVKANAKLAAVEELVNEWSGSLLELLGDQVATAFVGSFDRILASDPEVIAVVDGWLGADNNKIGRHIGGLTMKKCFGDDIPVTVTITRKGEGE